MIVVEGEHLHRNVSCARILLEMVEDGPAEHVGQEDIEGDGGGIVFAREGESFGAGHGGEDFESLVVGQVSDDAGVVLIVFDDQHLHRHLLVGRDDLN